MTRASWAPNGEDVRVWRAVRGVERPFYVEADLEDASASMSAALDAEGWQGLLLVTDADLTEHVRRRRLATKVVHAVGSAAAGAVRVARTPTDSRLAPAARLADLLDNCDASAVHAAFLRRPSNASSVLVGLELDRWRPWVLCVAAVELTTGKSWHASFEPLIVTAGYRFVASDGLNRWYVAPEQEELADAIGQPFGYPDRVLDGWERADVLALRELVDDTAAEHRLSAVAAQVARDREVAALNEQLALLSADRDAALERERVLLRSKSWAVTRPLRSARLRGWLALQQWRTAQGITLPATVREPDGPGDARRRAALEAKVLAARRSAGP